jgi:multiple sugar transport system substrate-binding protein
MTTKMFCGTVGVGLIACLAAYSGDRIVSRSDRTDRITVIYWEKWTGSEGEEMQKVVNAFNQSQDKIFVKYLSISGIDQKTILATAGGNPPDVAGIWENQVFQFADADALTDLSAQANKAGLTRDYYIPSYYDTLSKDRRLWALPSTPASIALYVRSDLVPPEFATPETFPKTIEEMDALAFKISKVRKNGSLEFAGFLPSNPGWWNWSWGSLFGGDVFKDGSPHVDSKEANRALEWVASYAKKFGASSVQNFQSGFGNFSSPQDPFMEGKVAFELNGTWKANYIKIYQPNIKWFAVPFPYPSNRPDLAGHSILAQDVLVIPRGAKHPSEAFEFIKFVQGQEVMEGLCSSHGKNSPLAKVNDKFFATHPNKAIRLFDKLARSKQALFPPRTGFFIQLSGELNNSFQEVNSGSKSPNASLKDAQNRIDGLWATYQQQVLTK